MFLKYHQFWPLIVYCLNFCYSSTGLPNCVSRPSYCSSEATSVQQCPMSMPSLQCSYSVLTPNTTIPMLSQCDMSFAGPPYHVSISPYLFSIPNGCFWALNISWQIPQGGSPKFLTGFVLNVTGYFNAPNESKMRIFSFKQEPTVTNFKTKFFYDCTPVRPGQRYRVSLQSLPAVDSAVTSNVNVTVVNIPNLISTDGPDDCVGPWQPPATVAPSESSSSISVTFPAAPSCYYFTGYNVSLVDYSSGDLLLIVARKTVMLSSGVIYVEFDDVCPMTYRVMIRPFGSQECQCPSADGCECPVTEFSPISMSRSTCARVSSGTAPDDGLDCSASTSNGVFSVSGSTTKDVPVRLSPQAFSDSGSVSLNPPSNSQQPLAAAVGGTVAGLVVLGLLFGVIIFYVTKRAKNTKPSVLLIYSNDGNAHLNVVKCFAKFLDAYGKCRVIIKDDVCDISTNQSLLDWVSRRLRHANFVITIHSAASVEFILQKPTGSISDTFQAFYSLCCGGGGGGSRKKFQHKLVNVFFPYCRSYGVLKGLEGTVFQLTGGMQDLIEYINGSGSMKSTQNDAEKFAYLQSAEFVELRRAIQACTEESPKEDGSCVVDIGSRCEIGGSVASLACSSNESERTCRCGCLTAEFIPPDDVGSVQTDRFESMIETLNELYDGAASA